MNPVRNKRKRQKYTKWTKEFIQKLAALYCKWDEEQFRKKCIIDALKSKHSHKEKYLEPYKLKKKDLHYEIH